MLLLNDVSIDVYAAEQLVEVPQKQYEVYNGYGELVYTADSLQEAEDYIASGSNSQNRSASMSGQKVFFTWITKTAGIIELIGYTAYAINQYQMGEIEAKDIILTIISPPDLEEIIENYTQLGVYAVALSLQNPYPPHSYQATTWIKTNFYYILMP